MNIWNRSFLGVQLNGLRSSADRLQTYDQHHTADTTLADGDPSAATAGCNLPG